MTPRPRVFVFLQHGLSLEAWNARPVEDRPNASSPYGYQSAAAVVDMTWSRDRGEGRLRRSLRRAIRRLLGFDLVHGWRNRQAMRDAEIVWTHTEWESLAAAAVLRLTRNRTTRLIAQTVWLWDEWPRMSVLRRRLALSLLGRADVEVTLSDANRSVAQTVRGREVRRVPFGAGVDEVLADRVLAEPPDRSAGYVLAVGSDRHRDWATLHAAARLLPDLRFRVATLSPAYPRHDAPPNVEVTSAATLEDSYRLYAGAAVVVLPLLQNLHASGCTVAIEAQRMGRPLVTADVGGLGLYLGESGVSLYRAQDIAALADAIRSAFDLGPDGRRRGSDTAFPRSAGLTADDYAARFVLLTRWLRGDDVTTEQIEQRASVTAVLRP